MQLPGLILLGEPGTRVQTLDGALVQAPNADLVGGPVRNLRPAGDVRPGRYRSSSICTLTELGGMSRASSKAAMLSSNG